MSQPVIVANPGAKYRKHSREIDAAISAVLGSGRYIRDEHVETFERSFAAYCGTKHCIGVGNGTDAIFYALKALGIGPGDEVVTVSHSAVATVAAIEMTGAIPVFADIQSTSRCMCPVSAATLITPQVKAIMPVHIYGQPAPMDELVSLAAKHDLWLIEDCAQAHGATVGTNRVGSIGDVGVFSFYPTKNLGCFGDGGAIVTSLDEVADQVRLVTQYGWRQRYVSEIKGGNSRLDELHAAVLQVLLGHLDEDNAKRGTIAARYRSACAGVSSLTTPALVESTGPVYHLFVIEVGSTRRESFMKHMKDYGVGTALHYPAPIHSQPAYRGRVRGGESLVNTERLYSSIVSLPMYPELSEEEISQVCEALQAWRG